MPASIHDPVGERLPPALAVDTDLFVAALNSRQATHGPAWAFYQRLVSERTVVGICRPLLTLETRSALKKVAGTLTARDLSRLVEEAGVRVRGGQLLMWRYRVGPSAVDRRAFLMRLGELLLAQMLTTLELASTRFSGELLDESRGDMIDFGLDSHDALVLAVARRMGRLLDSEPHLASMDRRFERVDGLHLWRPIR